MSYQLAITPQEIERLPLVAFEGRIHVISQPGLELERALSYLRKQKIIGFDTESKPVFTPGQHGNGVALLQLSGPDQAFLFRVRQLGMPKKLCSILSNPEILKVGAACHDDVRGLQHLRLFEERGFVDLQKCVWEYGIRDKSVKKMSAIILGVRISKTQQLSNWEADKLSDAQKKYAATDAWICREMYL
ncbi:MAG: 3'-5' exonuclease domain-containing protein 2, partial [Bacteroidales bacterium]|nr:3'-5' exonuclease domain-containing protein 2 [Bacteroidales bacterium]